MSVAVLGEALIDLIIGEDDAYYPHLGGSPFNVAIGLARQGADVCYLSSLSDDRFGEQLYAALAAEQVRLPRKRRSRWPTSLAMVTLDQQGQPTYRLYREGVADKDTSLEEVVRNLPADLQIFHTGSLAITPSQLPKIVQLFELMRERGVLVSIDINIRLRASIDEEKYLSGVRCLLPYADIVKASDEDLAAFKLSADLNKTAAQFHKEMQGGLLILTEGRGGCVLFNPRGEVRVDAHTIDTVADTVGAGDTFHSAFLAFLLRSGKLSSNPADIPLETLVAGLDFAGAAAAINVSRAGCNPPTEIEVNDFLERARSAV